MIICWHYDQPSTFGIFLSRETDTKAMVRSIPSPWNSLFARSIIAVITLGHAGGFIAALQNGPTGLLVMTCFTVPLGAAFFAGTFYALRISPGRRVGGLLYQSAALQPGEDVLTSFPEQRFLRNQTMILLTTERVLQLPARFFFGVAAPRTIRIADLRGVAIRNLNSPVGRRIRFEGPSTIDTKPILGFPLMNLPKADRLPDDLSTALVSAGLAPELITLDS
jgi:hypothetical protein